MNAMNIEGPKNFRDYRDWLRTHLAVQLGIEEGRIEDDRRFRDMGLDSSRATHFAQILGQVSNRALPVTLLWDHPTVDALARFLSQPEDGATPSKGPARPSRGDTTGEPIAVIGMGCRFPGGGDGPHAFWRALCQGVDAIAEVPASRFDIDAYYDPQQSRTGTTRSRWGGFLNDVESFDPAFFGISPREAVQMDPQQRLMLELAWEAIADAGIAPSRLRGSETGVYVGAMWTDYLQHLAGPDEIVQHTATGQDLSIIPARLSYLFGLGGPSMQINTACSSSLVAIHQACRALRSGECDMALAGAVNLILAPHSTIAMGQFGGLSPDGRAKAFDARADGYVRGEGGGLVLLKPLSAATADGDAIYCLIRGSAINNDGFSNGLTAPNPKAQERVLVQAYADANIDPRTVAYVEAHGTGTFLGDPIEVGALGAVLGLGREPGRALRIGSCKTNIGHLEAAAGIAGFIKTAMALHHRRLPGQLHFCNPNPNIPFNRLNVQVQDRLTAWPEGVELVAGVSSFGFGGTNAHVVLGAATVGRPSIVPLSADDESRLAALIQRQARHIAQSDGDSGHLDAHALASARYLSGGPCKAAFVATSQSELIERLNAFSADQGEDLPAGQLPVFVFSGQGANWRGMARDLLRQEPVFAARIAQCDALFAAAGVKVLKTRSLADFLARGDWNTNDNALMQPLAFAVQIGLAALWRSWGVIPAATIGHSLGEVAAAHCAGVLDLRDAVEIVAQRGRLMQRIADRGTMLLVECDPQTTEALIREWSPAKASQANAPQANAPQTNASHAISIGCYNHPKITVITGATPEVGRFSAFLVEREVGCRPIRINIAGHSAQLDPLKPKLVKVLRGIEPLAGQIPMVSTVHGDFQAGGNFTAAYWADNMREPVRFFQGIDRLIEAGHRWFLEIGPHPTLSFSIKSHLQLRNIAGGVLHSLKRDEDGRASLFQGLAEFYRAGLPIQWQRLFASGTAMIQPFEPAADWEKRDAVPAAETSHAQLLTLSAHQPAALEAMANGVLDLLDAPEHLLIEDLCHNLAVRRDPFEFRLAVVAGDRRAARDGLFHFLQNEAHPDLRRGRATGSHSHKIAFVFPGQGSQWLGMGRQLFQNEPAFRRKLLACQRAFAEFTDWPLIDTLFGKAGADSTSLDRVDVVQPCLFAVQVGIAEVWRAWGVAPDAVIGHSMGEIAAFHVAGILDLRDASRIICLRSRMVRQYAGPGAMAVGEMSPQAAARIVAESGGQLAIAAINGPKTVVFSGEIQAVDELLKDCQAQGLFCRRIDVDYASHGPAMEAVAAALLEALGEIGPHPAAIPAYSTLTGEVLAGPEADAAYWSRNIREPVGFYGQVNRLIDDGCTAFLEISAHPVVGQVLESAVAAHDANRPIGVFPSLLRDQCERTSLLRTLGALFTAGHAIDWKGVFPNGGHPIKLPPYPWQKQRYWLPTIAANRATQPTSNQVSDPLLGERLASPLAEKQFQSRVSLESMSWLADHRVFGAPVFPASAYLTIARFGGARLLPTNLLIIADFEIHQALVIQDQKSFRLQTVFRSMGGGFDFSIYSADSDTPAPAWTLHAQGRILTHRCEASSLPGPSDFPFRLLDGQAMDVEAYYRRLRQLGLDYGPCFRGIAAMWRAEHEVIGRIELPKIIDANDGFPFHPAFLDACLQLYFADLDEGGPETTALPVGIRDFCLTSNPGEVLWVHLRRSQTGTTDITSVFDLDLFGADKNPIGYLRGLQVRPTRRDLIDGLKNNQLKALCHTLAWEPLAAEAAKPRQLGGVWLIFADSGGVAVSLAKRLQAAGSSCRLIYAEGEGQTSGSAIEPLKRDDFRKLLESTSGKDAGKFCGVAFLWGLDAGSGFDLKALTADQAMLCGGLLHLVQALAETSLPAGFGLWLATRGSQAASPGRQVVPAGAMLWGMGRTLDIEHPEMSAVLVDLDPAQDQPERAAEALFQTMRRDLGEPQLAYRDGRFLVPRLVQVPGRQELFPTRPEAMDPRINRRLAVSQRGYFDRLILAEETRLWPGPGEIEIRVHATGLNFRDVMNLLGTYPGDPGAPGIECAGTVTAVGEAVIRFQVGDEVAAMGSACFADYVCVDERLVMARPAHIGLAQAASLPIVFLTVIYALQRCTGLSPRKSKGSPQRVLIHAGAGGVGLAAIQWAQLCGAEIFATAGTPVKRAYLEKMGVAHVFNSRTLDFAEEILAATSGAGVDIVLNSLRGEAISRSLATLRRGGHFVELGKIDIWDRDRVAALYPEIDYHVVDLLDLAERDPNQIRELMDTLTEHLASGGLKPLAQRHFPIGSIESAMRLMAQGGHRGKIVLTHQTSPVTSPRREGQVLITGGTGALGLLCATHCAAIGAKRLILLSRGGADPATVPVFDALRRDGVEIEIASGDVTDIDRMRQIFASIAADGQGSGERLRGVIHAAGVLSDGMLIQQDWSRFASVLGSKITGTAILDELCRDYQLDFFWLFSSAAALLGSPGQANYAAANAFLDAYAAHRHAQGQAGLSINWGPWTGIGLAAGDNNRGVHHWRERGIGAVDPVSSPALMRLLSQRAENQVAVFALNRESLTGRYAQSLLNDAASHGNKRDGNETKIMDPDAFLDRWRATPPHRSRQTLFEYVCSCFIQVMGLPSHHVSDPDRGFNQMGMDSLMTVAFRNRLQTGLARSLPATLVFNHPNLNRLTDVLLAQLNAEENDATAKTNGHGLDRLKPSGGEADSPTDWEIGEDLTGDELVAMINEELEDLIGNPTS